MKKFTSLTRNQDFKRVYAKGRYISSALIVTYVFKSKLNLIRFGITTSKKIGNAVKRNRSRRIIKAAFSAFKNKLVGRCDIVFVARKNTPFVKSTDVSKEMFYQLKKLGVLKWKQ